MKNRHGDRKTEAEDKKVGGFGGESRTVWYHTVRSLL